MASIEVKTERDLIHLLGQALEILQREHAPVTVKSYGTCAASIALHEYQHYCFGRRDFGSGWHSDLLMAIQAMQEAP